MKEAGLWTIFIPGRPPGRALTITGKPISLATRSPSSSSVTAPSLPGTTGTFTFCTARRASILSPIRRIASEEGPMNRTP